MDSVTHTPPPPEADSGSYRDVVKMWAPCEKKVTSPKRQDWTAVAWCLWSEVVSILQNAAGDDTAPSPLWTPIVTQGR